MCGEQNGKLMVKQWTIYWHVDDLKSSPIDLPKVKMKQVNTMMDEKTHVFGQLGEVQEPHEAPLLHNYLWHNTLII